MLRRVIIRAFLALAGVITAVAAPLNPEHRNTAFQPGSSLARPAVLKPAATARWGRTPRWSGAQARQITPGPRSPAPVAAGGHAGQAAAKPIFRPAGGLR